MTEKQKKLAIIIGVIVIALILLLSSKKGAGTTIVNQEQAVPIQVSIPSLNIPERSGIAVNVPGLPSFTPYQYSAISPCMCNGAETLQSPVSPISLTLVTNTGCGGSNIYNYAPPVQQDTIQGLYGIWRG